MCGRVCGQCESGSVCEHFVSLAVLQVDMGFSELDSVAYALRVALLAGKVETEDRVQTAVRILLGNPVTVSTATYKYYSPVTVSTATY